MNFRYSPIKILLKKIYRYFIPVQKSSYTLGEVDDICAINLVPPKQLELFFSECISTLREFRGADIGDYLEFGVFNGSSLGSMFFTAQKMEQSMKFFGFDSFEGLPEKSENEDSGVRKKGFYTCSFEKMQGCLRDRNIDPNSIIWIRGRYNETLHQETIYDNNINNIGIVFIDCDTYSSSKLVLDFIGPLIQKPTILCFDDRKLNDLDIKELGEYKSFNEWLDNNKQFNIKEIKSYNRKSKSFLINLK